LYRTDGCSNKCLFRAPPPFFFILKKDLTYEKSSPLTFPTLSPLVITSPHPLHATTDSPPCRFLASMRFRHDLPFSQHSSCHRPPLDVVSPFFRFLINFLDAQPGSSGGQHPFGLSPAAPVSPPLLFFPLFHFPNYSCFSPLSQQFVPLPHRYELVAHLSFWFPLPFSLLLPLTLRLHFSLSFFFFTDSLSP